MRGFVKMICDDLQITWQLFKLLPQEQQALIAAMMFSAFAAPVVLTVITP